MRNRKDQEEPPRKWPASSAADGERHEAELRQGQLVWTLTVALGVAVLALYQITSNRTPLAVRTFDPMESVGGDPTLADRAPASVSASRQPYPVRN
jgi:hypothetical protein